MDQFFALEFYRWAFQSIFTLAPDRFTGNRWFEYGSHKLQKRFPKEAIHHSVHYGNRPGNQRNRLACLERAYRPMDVANHAAVTSVQRTGLAELLIC